VAPERLVQARAATVRGTSMAGTVSGGVSRAHEEAPTVTVSRPQATNEDLSDWAEACGEAGGLRSSLASMGHGGRADGSREAGVAQPTGGRSAARQSGGSSEGTRL